MKGIVFNLFEEFITEELGEEMFEEILERSQLITKEPFVGPGSYPDEDLTALAGKAVELMGISPAEAFRGFGRFCFPRLAEKYPGFVDPHDHPKPFLMSIDSVVHVEVKKLYKDAETPSFEYEEPAGGSLIIIYRSGRKLCSFMEGLISGVGYYYKSGIRCKQSSCMLEGAESCRFELEFS